MAHVLNKILARVGVQPTIVVFVPVLAAVIVLTYLFAGLYQKLIDGASRVGDRIAGYRQ